MVPTELLAIQHYEQLLNLLDKIDLEQKPSIALLTGSTPTKQARVIRQACKPFLSLISIVLFVHHLTAASLCWRQALANGEISIVIGTHSLIAERVEFACLRIAVVDEQHRFGVIQRGRFNSKVLQLSYVIILLHVVRDWILCFASAAMLCPEFKSYWLAYW